MQSVQLLAKGWTVRGSNPGEARDIIFSTPVRTGPGAHPASSTTRTVTMLGPKRPRRGVDYPPTSNAEIKERVELQAYFNHPYVPPTACYGVTLAQR
jgi:hypothetical protein